MRYLPIRRKLAGLLAALQIVVSCASVLVPQVYAQTLDTEPPDVGFDTVDEARKGDSQVFTVTATDNQSIQSVVIFYRMGPNADYQSANMMRIGETSLYTLTIPANTIPESTELIQYYIEAKDQAGNRTLQGFSFDPGERTLIDSVSGLADNTPPQAREEESVLGSLSTTQKVVYTVLGVIVVGAVIAAAGSSDSGGGSGGQTTQLTLTVPALDVGQ